MIKAVIFDMDGLLVDSEPLWMQAEIEIFDRLGVSITPEDCKKMQGVKIADVVSHWYNERPWTGSSQQQVIDMIVRRVEELIIEKGRMQPGVIETLEFFNQRKIPMAVASSSDPHLIELVVKKLGIGQYFQFLHSSQYVKRGKPYPDIFLSAAEKLGVNPQACLVFEDSVNGVIAGKKAQMTVVAVPYPDNYDNPGFDQADMKIRSLTEWDEQKFELLSVKA